MLSFILPNLVHHHPRMFLSLAYFQTLPELPGLGVCVSDWHSASTVGFAAC